MGKRVSWETLEEILRRGKMSDEIDIVELKQMWKGFKEYALDNCIDLSQEDDFGDWWDCYVAGYLRCDNMINETVYPPEHNSKVMLDKLRDAGALKEK